MHWQFSRYYLIDQTGFDWQSLLKEWHWLLPPEFRVWMLTRVGDLFITLLDGSIHMLDVGAGTLKQVATSRHEFCTKMDEPGVADDWLMIPIVDQLVAAGAVLGPGQCYSFRQLPVLGGTYAPDNRMVFPIREHFGGWGSVQRQISDLPDGSDVVIKPVADADLEGAHLHSSLHRQEILASEICGCFYCCETFPPSEIAEWIDKKDGVGKTALCPRCSIDSVIGSGSGIQITRDFLKKMQQYWF